MAETKRRKTANKKKVTRTVVLSSFATLFLAALGVLISVFAIPETREADLYEYYGVSEEETAVYLNGARSDVEVLRKNGTYYMPLETVQQLFNDRFYVDEETLSLLYVLPDQMVEMKPDETTDLITEKNLWYMSLDTVKRYSDFQWVSFEAPNRLFMAYSIHEAQKTVTAEQETVVRVRAGIRGKVVSVEPENTRFSVLSEENGWLKVLSENGAEGYVKTNTLSEIRETIPENPSYVKPVFERMEFAGNISLGFDYVDNQKYGIIHLNEHVEAGEKVNVISPTWYVLQGDDGSFLSRADSEYIRIAHENNMEVWPLVENFTGQNDVLRTLRSFTARQKMIATLIGEMEAYGFDGLNLDFEGLSAETAVHYIQFIRELRLALNGRGKYLSVDTYIPYSWNAKYRIGELGELADYVVVMCYDEAWEKAGPNASLNFVSGGIEKSLNAVSKDRLLIGIPFYTYGWYEADGVLKKSEISMKKCAEILNEIQHPEWLEAIGCYHGNWDFDGVSKEIWFEDLRSSEQRLRLIAEKQLKGVGIWRLGQEDTAVWPLVERLILH